MDKVLALTLEACVDKSDTIHGSSAIPSNDRHGRAMCNQGIAPRDGWQKSDSDTLRRLVEFDRKSGTASLERRLESHSGGRDNRPEG
ncbi:MAG: hypothetical protein ACXADX_14575 [Candidatus Hodarchaeales archaeon]